MNRNRPDVITSAEMQALEQAAIASGRVTGLELMERAGEGVVEAIFEEWPDLGEHAGRAVVLCGPGNNGGDGFVVARLLKARGWDVEVVLHGDPEKLPADAKVNFELWDGETRGSGDAGSRRHPNLMIDALFGIGLSRPIDDPQLWEWLWLIDDAIDADEMRRAGSPGPLVPPRTIAIDVPSGLDADSGTVIGDQPEHGLRAARVMLTVTFHMAKPCHLAGDGPEYCGKVVVKDIGL